MNRNTPRNDPRKRQARLLPEDARSRSPDPDFVMDVGWGRLIFGNTFKDVSKLVATLQNEAEHERDIAIYVDDPHVALSRAPQDVFLDPSHTFRLYLQHYRPAKRSVENIVVRPVQTKQDAQAINEIYAKCKMVPVSTAFLMSNRPSRRLTYLVAEDDRTGQIVGTVMGVDHGRAYNDPEAGTSLWCLAVDPQCQTPGVGEALVRHLAELFQTRGRSFMDLSVMHDNAPAQKLYERLGFKRIPTFTLKRKNPVNEKLFAAPQPTTRLNPYAQIIISEALRRGIAVDIEDEETNMFALTFGGRKISCRESLSELTTAVALQRCDDKSLTHRLLEKEGLCVPAQIEFDGEASVDGFLKDHSRVVVKPVRGEQGAGISVDISHKPDVMRAVDAASQVCDRVILEQFCEGQDLRIIVIDHKVVAAAVRRPAAVLGDGLHTVKELIEIQSRRRKAATGGESQIPIDGETERCVTAKGFTLDTVLGDGVHLDVRRTANLHTGGTIHDVTARLHLTLVDAAVKASRALDIPVVGFDFLVPAVDGPDYVIIEANERPGLANHEPRPTAERFVDLLFPQTAARRMRSAG